MNLTHCTGADLVIPHLRTRDAAGIIQELSQVLQRTGRIVDLLRFYHTALNRELMVSSEVESGVAFPHGRASEVTELVFALGRADAPVAWGTNPVPSVRIVFLIAVPEGDAGQFLNLACGLTHLARTPVLMERLLRAGEPESILEILREVPLREAARSGGSPAHGPARPNTPGPGQGG